ncbi:unnamed protein product [Arctia plantaginis]|uniref:Uncharacterized protein n=1 Tax=Arctia plantaginis TaxID=874455 RepID=A0A8S1B804_ARCPL|nr:unnamed protein product [Arctia plantaginis]CAB3255758.1 unnamed protein product [Arctia plantaginis]
MCRVVMFFVFMFAVSAARDDAGSKCHRLHHKMVPCCTGITMRVINEREELKECYEKVKPGPPFSCDLENCIAKKFGYYGEDGNLDTEVLARLIENKYENNEQVITAIKEKCLNGDISKHGPPNLCVTMKMKHCFNNQFLKTCPEWSNEGECSGFQDLVAECVVDD